MRQLHNARPAIEVLVRCLDDETLANVVNHLLCAEENPRLTDEMANFARDLFDGICKRNPEIVRKAQEC